MQDQKASFVARMERIQKGGVNTNRTNFFGMDEAVPLPKGGVQKAVEKRIADNKSNFRRWGAGYLLYALLDTLVDRLLFQTEEIEDATTELEDSILKGTDDWDLNEVYRLKRIVVRLSRLAQPLKDMVSVLEHYEHPLLPTTLDMYLRDLYDHAIRAADRIELADPLLGAAQVLEPGADDQHLRRPDALAGVGGADRLVAGHRSVGSARDGPRP